MKHKLCAIIPHYSNSTSNHAQPVIELLRKLAKKHKVFLFIESGEMPENRDLFEGCYLQKPNSFAKRALDRLYLFTQLRLQGYDRFYCHYAELSTILASVVTRVLGGKTLKWHCVQEHKYAKPWRLQHLKEKLFREVPLALSWKLANNIVTCTPKMKDYYQEYYQIPRSKIHIVPNFVCTKRFTTLSPDKKEESKKQLKLPNKKILLFVHWLSERKGAKRLIPLAERIKSDFPDLHLLVVGGGPLLDSLKEESQTKKLTKHLSFTGAVPNKNIPQYFQSADVFIMPSITEEFGRVLVEAMATGLPIIATKTYGSMSILSPDQQKYLVEQDSYLEIVSEADKLLKTPKKYKSLQKIGYDNVKNYSLRTVLPQFEKIMLS